MRISVADEGWGWKQWWVRVNGIFVWSFHKRGDAYEIAHRLRCIFDEDGKSVDADMSSE